MSGPLPGAAGKTVEWLERARLDVNDARALYETSPSSYDNVGFLCQQATEKVIKTFLVAHDVDFPKTHDIRTLLVGYVAAIDSDLAVEARFADRLTPYAVAGRYPAGFGMVGRECAEELLELMDRAWALFEPRIAEVLAARAADEDAYEAEADEPDADPDA